MMAAACSLSRRGSGVHDSETGGLRTVFEIAEFAVMLGFTLWLETNIETPVAEIAPVSMVRLRITPVQYFFFVAQ